MAAYGLLTAMTPFVLISLLLLIGGFLRSLQFTALNALSYADIDRNEVSKATSLYTVAQQISFSAGVAVAAFILESAQALRGGPDILANDFSIAFLIIAGVASFSVLQFQWLEHVPAKLHDFADKNMLQLIDLARFLFAQVIPPERKAR
jgi:fatty acid desaturase